MATHYNYRTYTAQADPDLLLTKLTADLQHLGFKRVDSVQHIHQFKYRSLRFSSTKPLTCISRLSLETAKNRNTTTVKFGVTFIKIKYYTIFILLLLCVVIPAAIGLTQRGVPVIPPTSLLGIPLGFMVHYHVRWRVFRALGRLVASAVDQIQ